MVNAPIATSAAPTERCCRRPSFRARSNPTPAPSAARVETMNPNSGRDRSSLLMGTSVVLRPIGGRMSPEEKQIARQPSRRASPRPASHFAAAGAPVFSIDLSWRPLMPPRTTGVPVAFAGTSAMSFTVSFTECGVSPKST